MFYNSIIFHQISNVMKNYLLGIASLMLLLVFVILPQGVEAQDYDTDVGISIVDIYSTTPQNVLTGDAIVYQYDNLTYIQSDVGTTELYNYTYEDKSYINNTISKGTDLYSAILVSDYNLHKLPDITETQAYSIYLNSYQTLTKEPYRQNSSGLGSTWLYQVRE